MGNPSTGFKPDTRSVHERFPARKGKRDTPKTSVQHNPESEPSARLSPGQPFNPYKLFRGIFIPEALVPCRAISPGAKLCYGRLTRYAGENGECWPSMQTLGNELGVSDRQARAYVAELEDVRLLKRQVVEGDTNRVIFLWHVVFSGGALERLPRKDTSAPPRKKGSALPRKDTSAKESHHQKSQKEESQFSNEAASPRAERKAPGTAESQNRKPFPLNCDDDERTKTERLEVLKPTTEEEAKKLVGELIGRRPENLPERTLRIIGRKFEDAGWSEPWIRYHEYAVKVATSPEKARDAFYAGLAKELINQRKTKAMEWALASLAPPAEQPLPIKPVCKDGLGCDDGLLQSGQACACKVGQLRALVMMQQDAACKSAEHVAA